MKYCDSVWLYMVHVLMSVEMDKRILNVVLKLMMSLTYF